jgi:hypothetical protein
LVANNMDMIDEQEVKGWNPKGVNPAKMTFDEYYGLVNPDDKDHPEHAYDVDLKQLNSYLNNISDYPILLRNVTIKGLAFQIRLNNEKRQFTKRVGEFEHKRDANGDLVYYNDDEIKQKGWKTHDFIIGVFNDKGERIAAVQDEWGTILIMVAREYRGFGFGPILGKIARTLEPAKSSGGFTPSGYRNFVKTYREFVRDALTQGLYREWIAKGEMTKERARHIIDSAKLQHRPKRIEGNLNTSDPKDWLLYGKDGSFVLYDRKLKDVYQGPDSDWNETFIKGFILVRINDTRNGDKGIVVRLGADNPKIKSFLLNCGMAFCREEGVPFYVDPDDEEFVDHKSMEAVGEPDHVTGRLRQQYRSSSNFSPVGMTRHEELFRKTFDRYDEFFYTILELADAKYQ